MSSIGESTAMLIGYARISTIEQNLDLQLDALCQISKSSALIFQSPLHRSGHSDLALLPNMPIRLICVEVS